MIALSALANRDMNLLYWNTSVDGVDAKLSKNGQALHYEGNIFLKVEDNIITEQKPQYVYTLGIADEHSYCVGGVVAENCFYHSLLYLTLGPKYTRLDENERRSFAVDIRTDMALALSPETFRLLGGGAVEVQARYPTDYIRSELKGALIDTALEAKEQPPVTVDQLNAVVDEASKYPSMDDQADVIATEMEKYGYDQEDILNVIDDARLRLWRKYRSKLRDCSAYTTHDSMEYVMRTSGRNIFVISDATRLPIKFVDCSLYDPAKPSIVILNIDEVGHFEAVASKDGQRSFAWNHPLIQAMYKYLCSVESE